MVRHRVVVLLTGVSALAAIAAGAEEARAADPIRIVNTGANGTNATTAAVATPGLAGTPVNLTNATIIANARPTIIELGSVGGAGGEGRWRFLDKNIAGAKGGDGGAVTLVETATVSGGSENTVATPLLFLYSKGGAGGYGYKTDNGGIGAGGLGGTVTLDLRANVATTGSATPALYLLSQGGAAGVRQGTGGAPGGTSKERMQRDSGGAGGAVVATLAGTATVSTTGANAPAVVLASNGGAGGDADGTTSTYYASEGGAGGSVTLTNNGKIATTGENSSGVIAQSVGGSGGRGGGGALTEAAPGADGGNGGAIAVTNAGTITTRGNYSFGIIGQSVGGMGGQGKTAIFGSGGAGGAAGSGGAVSLANSGTIQTRKIGATAIVAQSIGGGNALDALQAGTPTTDHSGGNGGGGGILPWSTGGSGGPGGNGGAVVVVNSGTLSTGGNAAYGALLQSIGGGGGTGGGNVGIGAFLAVAIGGTGGGGGDGGAVTFDGTGGRIGTTGNRATGVLAQSIGGGGGTGGYATAASGGLLLSASVAVGGSGGGGGAGGVVTVRNASTITTWGEAADAIAASSIGGGGGTGGDARAYSASLSAVVSGLSLPAIAISSAVGGSGGGGGAGGTVDIANTATLETGGVGSVGIRALSVGGGGGEGGNALAYGLSVAVSPDSLGLNVTAAVGGSGGTGGNGGAVHIDNSGTVVTSHDSAAGLLLQSIGGGGGDGGAAVSTGNALGLYADVAYALAVGGRGGGGGSGGSVQADNSGVVSTSGNSAAALFAQSVGGGGGNGGEVVATVASGLTFDKTLNDLAHALPLADSVTATTVIGGTGGSGGNGGRVVIVTAAGSRLETAGAQSVGLFAQSVGGGGGTGGGGSAAAKGTVRADLSIGGRGGSAGSGGTVEITQGGTIATKGDASHGILAQSIGGGGGSGGTLKADRSSIPDNVNALWLKLRAETNADAFDKWAADNNLTPSKEAIVLFLTTMKTAVEGTDFYQSIAKSFKDSQFYKDFSAFRDNAQAYLAARQANALQLPDVSLVLSVGGNGGSGNVGGAVTVDNAGAIATLGDGAHGILAQSVGGGGGQGGLAYASGASSTNVSGRLGGSGGGGNAGGTVTLSNTGSISTAGAAAYGLVGQSIGGGGGAGVVSPGAGNRNIALSLSIGGAGGTGADGGDVSIANAGSIATTGKEAHGLVAQSIGGGGGIFLVNPKAAAVETQVAAESGLSQAIVSALLDFFGFSEPKDDGASDPATWTSASLSLGGSGGASGHGGAVGVTVSGTISTAGAGAFGVFAQSVGGGGGIANTIGAPDGVTYSASLGASGGAAGDGGPVSVTLAGENARIATSGNLATAVFAQSIGGGGGYAGVSSLLGKDLPIYGGAAGTSGDGGRIVIQSDPAASGFALETSGTTAHGIWAMSIGGGGGASARLMQGPNAEHPAPENADASARGTGQGGAIDITLAGGSISATGAGSFGILAQSGSQNADGSFDATRRGGDVTIDYTGTIEGGSGDGAAIGIDGGDQNLIEIGAGSVISAASGKAILTSFGNDMVVNYGTVVGDVDLGTGETTERNQFTNEAGGTYRSAGTGTIKLGGPGAGAYANLFQNLGTFDVGGVGQIATASVTQGTLDLGGVLLADVSRIGANVQSNDVLTADRLKVSGVAIKPYAVNGLLPGNFTVVTTANMLFGGVPATAGASPVSPISWSVAQTGNSLVISPSAAFLAKAQSLTSRALTKTERSMLQSAQTAWDSSNAGMAGFFAQAANLTTKQQFKALVNSASASESNNQPAVGQSFQSLDSLNASLSCPAFEGDGLRIHEGECVWSRVVGSRMARFGGSDGEGFNQSGMSYRVGAQWEVAPDWYLGATAAYNMSWLQASSGLSSTNGTGGDVSVALKHQMGPLLLAASLQAGYGTYETNNTLVVGTQQGAASNDTDLWTAGLKLRAAYEFAFQTWYVRPYVDVNVLHLSMPGYTFAANGMSVSSGSIDHWSGVLQPVLEVGSRVNVGDGAWVRPYVGVGGMFVAGNSINTTSTFSYGGTQGISYETSNEMPNALLDVGGGVQFMNRDGYEVRGQYRAQLANDFVGQELSLRLSMKF
ncbi:autotransporter outer membrane beta-barrel domain-containing protein [Segnochrobactrum spirostomi]|uniref:Autotransporter outer membrane beta-barrel domain-containing protein n=1 Tax=Segnochrobactrum spirostomi TaxID=2608987 RepID=A0A6A7Y8K1_9HYPH|nr:autotransporter outer membrane beta-barrel domain-containing protein [Segnochrobactrum spirostomi]MQT14667.1 autotransporter outer membrane beta-barrel domain-containing protein [Segnochrobactrum spirostomi]